MGELVLLCNLPSLCEAAAADAVETALPGANKAVAEGRQLPPVDTIAAKMSLASFESARKDPPENVTRSLALFEQIDLAYSAPPPSPQSTP
jgi:hypothetical protein